MSQPGVSRRFALGGLLRTGAAMGTGALCSVKPGEAALLDPKDKIKITRIETFFVQPRSVFLKMSTDAGIVGWGEPSLGL